MSKEKKSYQGIGLKTELQIILVILKAHNIIDWSWWLVFSPSIIVFGIAIIILILLGVAKLLD